MGVVAVSVAGGFIESCASLNGLSGADASTSSSDGTTGRTGKDAGTSSADAVADRTVPSRMDGANDLRDASLGCTPGAQQCSDGGTGIETCSATGQWSPPWPCATGTCNSASCIGGTMTGLSCPTTGAGQGSCPQNQTNVSCCVSVDVPGSVYYRTYENAGGVVSGTADPASVSSLRLDTYLVTVARFRHFVDAVSPRDGGAAWSPSPGAGKHAHLNGGRGLVAAGMSAADGGLLFEQGWSASDDINIAPTDENLLCSSTYPVWTASPGPNEYLPMTCVTWAEAYAFCIWDGGFLPSEAEWENAAAAGSEQRQYPWGEAPPGTDNEYAICGDGFGNCYYPTTAPCHEAGVSAAAPVGSAPKGAASSGQLDMAGEVYEWVLDWESAYFNPCIDCAWLTVTGVRARRGGSFYLGIGDLTSAHRGTQPPTTRAADLGFRCAKTP